MEKEKVTSKTSKEFIKEVAIDCVANMKEEDKEYIRNNPFASDYHFGYAMYIRNHYIHNKDFSEAGFRVSADDISSKIMKCIFSLLLPEEFYFDDSFSEDLFGRTGFIRLRKGYHDIYGQYPVEMISRYRKKSPADRTEVDRLDLDDIWKIPKEQLEVEFEISKEDRKQRATVIDALIDELAEVVWHVEDIKKTAKEYEIDPESLDAGIQKIKDIFYAEKEYIPMEVVFLPYRDRIGEEKYRKYRELLSIVLDAHPKLMEKIDKICFSDRELAKVVLKHTFALGQLPEYKNDDEMVRYALEHNGDAIQYVGKKYLENREWVRFAIEHSENGTIMFHECMKQYRSDREFVYLACRTHKWNFVYVDESFHDDYELALIVISDNDQMNNVFRFLSDRLKNDISLALIDAAGEYPDVEEYSEQLRDSDEVAEKLIEVHGIDCWRFSKMSDRIKKKYGYKEK